MFARNWRDDCCRPHHHRSRAEGGGRTRHSAARERAILAAKAPAVPERLSAQVVAFVQRLRSEDLFKLPGVAETIDWAQALTYLNQTELAPAAVDETLGVLLKYQDDIAKVRGAETARLVTESRQAAE